jgi:hypothetical protein
VADGKPLDAGTVQIYQQNIHHLRNQTMTTLVTSLGPDSVPAKNGWADLDEGNESARTEQWFEISWIRELSGRWGPFPVRRDNDSSSTYGEEHRPRRIHCWAWGKCGSAATLYLYFALTATPRPPTDSYIAFSRQTTASTAVVKLSATLELSVGELVPRVSSLPTAGGSGSTASEEFYVWIGWRIASGTAYVSSVGAFERDG